MIFHMTRTTLMLDETLLRDLKKLAAAEGRTLTDVTREILSRGLAAKRQRPRRRRALPSFSMRQPLVDLSDWSRVLADVAERPKELPRRSPRHRPHPRQLGRRKTTAFTYGVEGRLRRPLEPRLRHGRMRSVRHANKIPMRDDDIGS
jgi:hypothetical protein